MCSEQYGQAIVFRASEAERRKLDVIAAATGRTRSGVLRLLVRHARVSVGSDLPGAELAGEGAE